MYHARQVVAVLGKRLTGGVAGLDSGLRVEW
jgi:hypothetical protein